MNRAYLQPGIGASAAPGAAPGASEPVPSSRSDALDVRHVSKRFGTLEALRDISFTVGSGEIVALLGPSGCGKSTLLNIVAGLEPHDGGEIFLAGQPLATYDQWRHMAYLFQEDRLLPWRSVRDNVAFGLEAGNVGKAERHRRANAVLDMVGLSSFGDSWPHQLSGGMRSRVALARSLVIEPAVLLMDEPFSKLDPQTRTQMHEEVLRIQAMKNMTILFVTHDVEEAVVLADRIVLMAPRPGRIREIDTVSLPRPRAPTDRDVAEHTRQLRMKVHE
ncbi:ABC transporter ATP-binding protein [Bordetella genomosp. 11]|uniref:Nitrate/sulfonate/bicarbonate ABC transporter ATP-binding protein n=1 Tax=Bordetella genomosp. 11 TaxID=1416808 RepID=A0A261UF20_9BORD|nr:ABC transporter ATP-binding protein [Bordetella genomosp. 11]OZI60504.1 nitrate/sulfonate/bicarbonate ABC transporter ATP-binding protein [Bordetella genomosp. 11]